MTVVSTDGPTHAWKKLRTKEPGSQAILTFGGNFNLRNKVNTYFGKCSNL